MIRYRRQLTELAHLILTVLALFAAVWLRFEFRPDAAYIAMLWQLTPLALGAKLVTFRLFSLRDLAWKYLSFDDLLRITSANGLAMLVFAGSGHWLLEGAFPRSVYILDGLLSVGVMALARALVRLWSDRRHSSLRHSGLHSASQADGIRKEPATPRRILIYGAGKAGRTVLADLRAHPELAIDAVGFLDDDAAKAHLRLSGARVVGGLTGLPAVGKRLSIDEIWLALPRASGAQVAAILEQCHLARIPVKRIPPLAELVETKVLLDQLREVRIEDLLGRPPVTLQTDALRPSSARGSQTTLLPAIAAARNTAVVLVTGAGGSIGSELCRQIARTRPLALIGLDHSEAALYQIDQEMREQFPQVAFYPEVGNIQNPRRLSELFRAHKPDAVYHAAAYKHVPMMEAQVFEALENNVFGTQELAAAARAHQVKTFVLISSDKAVAPTNVMGATKRLAEMVCLGASQPGDGTQFLAVRFGNVLGSSGSVIPLFKRQIAAGGPVTVTHPDMRRYFMTIPEAVDLVLQAASLGSGGEIFVLDMGEPVRIVDLARKMILLSGLRPEHDVPIVFTGTRPGEKLFEELHTCDEETQATPHPKIRVYRSRATGTALPPDQSSDAFAPTLPSAVRSGTRERLEALRRCAGARDLAGAIMLLKDLIPDYSPSAPILRQALEGTGPGSERRRTASA